MTEQDTPKAVKLLLTWDIMPGREQDYFEFVVREFLPGMQKMGLEPNDAWFTVYGSQPQIMVSAQMDDQPAMQKLLRTPEWQNLTGRLLDYVVNFQYKIIEAHTGFQM